jgi:hypothetical protein
MANAPAATISNTPAITARLRSNSASRAAGRRSWMTDERRFDVNARPPRRRTVNAPPAAARKAGLAHRDRTALARLPLFLCYCPGRKPDRPFDRRNHSCEIGTSGGDSRLTSPSRAYPEWSRSLVLRGGMSCHLRIWRSRRPCFTSCSPSPTANGMATPSCRRWSRGRTARCNCRRARCMLDQAAARGRSD